MLRWLWTNSDSTPREPFPNLVVGLQSATNLMHRIGLMLLMDLLAHLQNRDRDQAEQDQRAQRDDDHVGRATPAHVVLVKEPARWVPCLQL